MANHLPECDHAQCVRGCGKHRCICDRLRDCEQRVRMDGINAVVAAQANSYQQGVAAAREAVAAAPAYYCEDQWSGADTHRLLSEALAAIDNLKEDK